MRTRSRVLPQPVHVATGGAPPAPALLERLDNLGFEVTHLYGLTETYGPAVICERRPDGMVVRARQGVANLVSEAVRVVDEHCADVPRDGRTVGEVVLRGNNVMLGYLRDEAATAAASTADGWFRTGDLGVIHSDGYLELTDRAKDVIISGGENIASVEVEQVLAEHPAVLETAVVAAPDPHWGEVPVAFVTLRPGADATADELIDHVRARVARFKAPRRVIFDSLPKTATGKIQKFEHVTDSPADSTSDHWGQHPRSRQVQHAIRERAEYSVGARSPPQRGMSRQVAHHHQRRLYLHPGRGVIHASVELS